MTGPHVTVALGDGSADGQVAVLAVHVVRAGPEFFFNERHINITITKEWYQLCL